MSWTGRFAFVGQDYVLEKNATLSVFDLGISRGYALTTSLRSYEGELFLWQKYVEKIYQDAENLDILPPYSFTEIYTILQTLLQKNGLKDAAFKILITGGPSYNLVLEKPTLAITCTPYIGIDPKFYEKGISLNTLVFERPYPEMKTTFYLPAIKSKAAKKPPFEVLYLSKENHILEASTSNLFIVKKNKLITPRKKVYKGITRELVLTLATNNYFCEQREIPFEELKEADEVFLTATYKDILPVAKIDQLTFSYGPVTKYLQKLMQSYVQKKDWIYKPEITQTIPNA